MTDTATANRVLDAVACGTPDMAETVMRVPVAAYNDPAIHAAELALFERMPRPVLAASEIARPDDYHVRTSLGRSLLVSRDKDGKAHVFLNSCRHRGAEPASGCGNARRHSCPYHGWAYSSKGELVAMPLAERNEGLDWSGLGLVELPSEERHGLVWAILTPGLSIDVAVFLGPVDEQLAALRLDRLDYHSALVDETIGANWKCVAEGLLESLHVPFVHRGTFSIDPKTNKDRYEGGKVVDLAVFDRFGAHMRYSLPVFGAARIDEARAALEAGDGQEWRQIGQIWWLFPGVLIAMDSYGFDFALLEPGETPGECRMRYGWLGPRQAPEGCLSVEAMADRARAAVAEDVPVWTTCGRGLRFAAHPFTVIGRNEKGIQIFYEIMADLVDEIRPEYG